MNAYRRLIRWLAHDIIAEEVTAAFCASNEVDAEAAQQRVNDAYAAGLAIGEQAGMAHALSQVYQQVAERGGIEVTEADIEAARQRMVH